MARSRTPYPADGTPMHPGSGRRRGLGAVHERGIARRLVEAALSRTADGPPGRVVVEPTPLAGTSARAFRLAWEAETEGTALAGVPLVVEERPAVLRCGGCDTDHRPDSAHDLLCRSCGAVVEGVVPADPRLRSVAAR